MNASTGGPLRGAFHRMTSMMSVEEDEEEDEHSFARGIVEEIATTLAFWGGLGVSGDVMIMRI